MGEGSNGGDRSQKRKPQRRASVRIDYVRSVDNLSTEGIKTLGMVNQLRHMPLGTIPSNVSAVFDNTSPYYDWLCSGWLVEERRMAASDRRLYRYYYDPMGRVYDTRKKVEDICQDIDKNRVVIILDT